MQLEKFLFCEMTRNEANGQATLIGLHSGDLVIVQQEAGDPQAFIIPNLSCVVVLGDMNKVRNIRIQWQIRFGQTEVLNLPEQNIPLSPKQFCNVMANFSPFPCMQGIGDYEFRLTVQSERG